MRLFKWIFMFEIMSLSLTSLLSSISLSFKHNIALRVAFLGLKKKQNKIDSFFIEIQLFNIKFSPKKLDITVFDAIEKTEPTGVFTMTGKREQSLRREIRQRWTINTSAENIALIRIVSSHQYRMLRSA